jgi:hypothetical protein
VDYGVDNYGTAHTAQGLTCENRIHRLCMRKSRSRFGRCSRCFSTEKSTGSTNLPVEKGCGLSVGQVLSPDIERTVDDSHPPTLDRPAGMRKRALSPVKEPADSTAVRYPSSVCSKTGDAVDRLAAAIDQLANDARDDSNDPELATRVAGLWQMVSDLDPELARRRQGYTALPGGGTSD